MKAKTIASRLLTKYGSRYYALKALSDAKYWFKKGFYAFGPDHSHKDMEEWMGLCQVKKELLRLPDENSDND